MHGGCCNSRDERGDFCDTLPAAENRKINCPMIELPLNLWNPREMQIVDKLLKHRYGESRSTPDNGAINSTLQSIIGRRSCRAFTERRVPDKLLDTLFATAFSAPSKSDLQQVSVILIDDPQKQQRIAGGNTKVNWIADAPIFMVWCGDNRRIRRVCEWKNRPFANDHLDAFMNAAVDAAITMQTFIIAAESVGLGCCPVSEIRDNIELLSKQLDLPDHVFPVAGLCVGWPAERAEISMRLPLNVTVHRDHYDDENLLDEIKQYDARREVQDQTPPERQRLVEIFAVSEKYGWSENRSRQYSQSMRADFGRYIRKQGFDLS
jgi:nitroreductase